MLENNLSEIDVLVGEIQEEIIDLSKEEQEKVVEARREDVEVLPDDAMKVLSKVTVKGVTASIDENIKAENIKLGVNILGIEGNVAPDKPDQDKTIYPSEEEQVVVADLGYELGKVIAKPVETESFEIVPSAERQVVRASEGKYIKEVLVEAVEDISGEVAEQEILLTELETQVNELSDKPKDMLQARVDAVNSCAYLFYHYNGDKIDFIDNLDTKNVTNMESMFYGCPNLEEVIIGKNFNTKNVTSMNSMFSMCEKIKSIPKIDTSNVTNMYYMFSRCYKLEELPQLDTSNVTNMEYMFQYCRNMKTYPAMDTRKVTTMKSMFQYMERGETIEGLDLRSITSASNQNYMFDISTGSSVNALANLTIYNIKWSLSLQKVSKLTDDSIINTFKELHDLTGGTTQTLTLSTPSYDRTEAIYVKLVDITDEMRAEDDLIDYKKPCVVCESTDEGAMTLKEYGISKNWTIAK